MKTIIASTLIAVGLLASIGTTANAAHFNLDSFFDQMSRDGK